MPEVSAAGTDDAVLEVGLEDRNVGRGGGVKILFGAVTALFALTVVIYWFNLDTKAVKLIEKPLMKHYDSMPRDNRL